MQLHSYQSFQPPASLFFDLLCSFGLLMLNVLFRALSKHCRGIMHAEELGHLLHATLLLVASIDLPMRLELGNQVTRLAQFADLDVCLRVVSKEEFLILSVRVHPVFQRCVLEQLEVSLCAEVLRLVSQQQLLEVRVVEDIWIHAPACVWAFLVIATETECEGSH